MGGNYALQSLPRPSKRTACVSGGDNFGTQRVYFLRFPVNRETSRDLPNQARRGDKPLPECRIC